MIPFCRSKRAAAATKMARCRRSSVLRCSAVGRTDALTRHQQWCAAEGLTGPSYAQQRAHLAAEAATELDRLGKARSRGTTDAA